MIVVVVDRYTLDIEQYLFFGGTPGQPLPDISEAKQAKRVTFDASGTRPVRRNHRDVPKRRFEPIPDMNALVDRLFGTGRPRPPEDDH